MLHLRLARRSSLPCYGKLNERLHAYCLVYQQRTQVVQRYCTPLRTYQHRLTHSLTLQCQRTLGLCVALATPVPTSLFYACVSGGSRTHDQQVMSLLLYQLSYRYSAQLHRSA